MFLPVILLIDLFLNGVTGQLVWSEEFDRSSVDTSKWNIMDENLGVNNEQQYYRPNNVAVSGGNLIITAKKESFGGQSYTSGRIWTQYKYTKQYGCFQGRMKVPLSLGMWPAFWMLGHDIDDVSWPKCGEIDIMEHVNDESKTYGTLHWDNNGHAMYGTDTNLNNADDWHIYSTSWDANFVNISVDGQQFFSMNTANMPAFNKPFFIILNLAVGGDFPGQTIDDSALPQQFIVDWVRVYDHWTLSGGCSDTCGSCGLQSRVRTCLSAAEGCPCRGESTSTIPCNIAPCTYPRNSCCSSYKAMGYNGAIVCGPQPQDSSSVTC